jgi:hypothetical protein
MQSILEELNPEIMDGLEEIDALLFAIAFSQ